MIQIQFGSITSHLKIGSLEILVFVLANKQKVLSLDDIQKALLFEKNSAYQLLDLVKTINRFSPITNDLLDTLSKPIKINLKLHSEENNILDVIDSKIFIELLKIIVQAKNNGYLNLSQLKHANSAFLLLEKINESDINELIDQASGFNSSKEAVINSYIKKLYEEQNDVAFKWIQSMPTVFFENIFEMIQTDWKSVNTNPNYSMEFLHNILFMRMDSILLSEMRTQIPKRRYIRKSKKDQDTELPKLKEYRIAVESLIKASGFNQNIFMQLLDKTFPKYKNRTPVYFKETHEVSTLYLSTFNKNLKSLLDVFPNKRA